MSLLEHLDELRARLFKAAIAFLVAFVACWAIADELVAFLVAPIRRHLFDGGDIVFIHLTEPFLIYMKASALAAVFVASPFMLYQAWAFISPGLYKREKRMALPFLISGTVCLIGGGAFGYYVGIPIAARWLIGLGEQFQAQITLRSAFGFEAWIILGMGIVFQMPVVIFFLSRVGIVTPAFLMKHFRVAVLLIAILAAVLTPTGDIPTLLVFSVPMILLYLLGVAVAWVFGRADKR